MCSDEIKKLLYDNEMPDGIKPSPILTNKRSPRDKTSITNGYREDTIICVFIYISSARRVVTVIYNAGKPMSAILWCRFNSTMRFARTTISHPCRRTHTRVW